MDFNPHANGTLGLEWFPASEGVVSIASNRDMAAMALGQTTGQVIDTVKVGLGTIPTRGGVYALEVYDNETAVAANLASQTAVPNEDVSVGVWLNEASGTPCYTSVDEWPSYTWTDYMWMPQNTAVAKYTGRLNTGTLTFTGKRILKVELVVYPAVQGGASLTLGVNLGGTDYPYGTFWNIAQGTACRASWRYNPSTKKPWTIADIGLFDTTDEWYVSGSTAAGGSYCNVYVAHMNIYYVDENRLAVGILDDSASGLTQNAYNTVTVLTPTGGAWTKDAANFHLYTLRRLTDRGVLNVPWLAGTTVATLMRGYAPTVDATYGYVTAMGDALARLHAVVPHVSGGADSVDSQPYADLLDAEAYTAHSVQQEFLGAVGTYGKLRILVKPASLTLTTASLVVTVRKRSDSSQIGGTFTLTRAAWDAAPVIAGANYKLIEGDLASTATLTAVQDYLEYTATAAAGSGWHVAMVDTLGTGSAAGFGGTTQAATVGGVENTNLDLVGTISTVPTTPTNFAVTVGTQSIDATVCGVATIERAQLSWTATALGADFGYYEIDRSVDGGTTWESPAVVTTEAVVSWYDYEAPRGISVCYRIRTARIDGALSNFSANVCVTKTGGGRDVSFVSNYDPTLNVAYTHEPQVDFAFLETDDAVLVAIYGADKHRGYRPTEDRGAAVEYTLAVGFDDAAPSGGGTGLTAFDPLRDIAKAQLPYVCVLDWHGNRIYAQLAPDRGVEAQPGGRYQATCVCIEVGGPYELTVTA